MSCRKEKCICQDIFGVIFTFTYLLEHFHCPYSQVVIELLSSLFFAYSVNGHGCCGWLLNVAQLADQK